MDKIKNAGGPKDFSELAPCQSYFFALKGTDQSLVCAWHAALLTKSSTAPGKKAQHSEAASSSSRSDPQGPKAKKAKTAEEDLEALFG